LYLCHRLWSPRDEFLKQWLGVFPIPDLFGRAIEVAALNVVHVIVPILIQQRHRQLNVLRGPVMRPFSDGRICGYHVIQRREPKPSGRPRLQLDAEVLGVSVRCAEHPEQDLRSHEGTQVSPGIQRLLQPAADRAKRQLEDVRGGRRAPRFHPFSIPPQESILLLGAGQRDSEVVVRVADAGEAVRGHDFKQMAFDVFVVHDNAVDVVDTGRRLAFWQKLQCPYAITPDGGEQIEGVSRPSLESGGNAPADGVAVR
jgi:hypothetical protein